VALERFTLPKKRETRTLELLQMHALDALYTDQVAELLVAGVPGITEDNVHPIRVCLNELLQNVFEWADSPVGCLVHTRWYKGSRSVRLAVVDRGVGIPTELRRARVQDLHLESDDSRLIEAAVTRPRLTSRQNQAGGLGLKTIRDIVCGRGGRLTVVSLGGKVKWSGAKSSRYSVPILQGTAIEIDIRPEAMFDPKEYVSVF
jgi:signal transduction histidine kinase